MKFEYGIIIFMGFLLSIIFALIASGPNDAPSLTQLNQINQQAVLAKTTENHDKFATYMSLMQKQLQVVASKALGIKITKIYLEEGFNFPFKDVSEVKLQEDQSQTYQICDIIPNIPTNLQKIRNTELFSMFMEKYHKYPIELFIQDERSFNSTVHYSFVATYENYTASTWFHMNSCTGQWSAVYNLSCRDKQNDEFMHTRYTKEIVASLEGDDFCAIHLEPWRQELYDYSQIISDEMKKHQQKIESIKEDPTFERVMAFQSEMDRIGLLGNMAGHAMDGTFDDEKMQDMKKEYNERFGSIPDDLLTLIEKNIKNVTVIKK